MKNFLVKLLTLILAISTALFITTACKTEEEHTHVYYRTYVNSTCTEKGYTIHKCSCGSEYIDEYVDPIGHYFLEYVYDDGVTCTTGGTKTAHCLRVNCKATDTKPAQALGHDFKYYTYNYDATCTANGTKTATCERYGCNETDTVEAENTKLNHDFKNYVYNNDATCGKNGTKTATCERDGCNETDTIEAENTKLNHDFKNYVYNNDATCTANGTKTATCERYGCNETDTIEAENTKLNHSYGDWVSNGDGTHTKTCSNDKNHKVTENCNGGTATCTKLATCVDCNVEYGSLKTHTYSNEYLFNDTHHWQNATCGCNLTQNYGEHSLDANGCCTICAHPITSTNGVLYDYSTDGTYIEVIGYEGNSTKIKIADTYDDLPVKTIYDSSFINSTITEIVIPNSVTSIGNSAFKNCSSLVNIVIPNSVTAIDSYAFDGCSKLEKVYYSGTIDE